MALPPSVSKDSIRAVYEMLAQLVAGTDGTDPTYMSVRPASYEPLGYEQIVSATLATATALTVPAGAVAALIQNNGTQAARWRDDAVDPTAAIGMVLAVGGSILYDGDLSAIKFIRAADGSILDIAYYG